MKRRVPSPDERRIETPQWALDRAGEAAIEAVEGIRASGVRVIGSLDRLTAVPRGRPDGEVEPVVPISPEVAATMAMGAILAGDLPTLRRPGETPAVEARRVSELTARELAGALARRVRHGAARRVRRGS
jgi:hypothetical protein